MRLAKKKRAFAVIVDDERFDNVDIRDLHPRYAYYFNLWQYSDSLQQRQDFDNDAYLYEIFLIFDEAKQEYLENASEERISNS